MMLGRDLHALVENICSPGRRRVVRLPDPGLVGPIPLVNP